MTWALVTGASKRIGRAIALELAAHGWDIVVHYRTSADEAQMVAEEIQNLGQNACLAEIDLSDSNATAKLIPALSKEIGPILALVNNAALFDPDTTDPDGTRHMAVNADAPRILSKALRDSLPKGERGVVINILDSSPVGPTMTAYGKSKAFLKDLTLNMAKSFAPQVRVNGVAPTYVLAGPRQSDESFRKLAQNKIVSPEQVALAVRRLVETPAANGAIVTVS